LQVQGSEFKPEHHQKKKKKIRKKIRKEGR
jgi:hypothetical protein